MTNVPLLNLTHSNRPILILKVGDDFWKGASLGPRNKKNLDFYNQNFNRISSLGNSEHA